MDNVEVLAEKEEQVPEVSETAVDQVSESVPEMTTESEAEPMKETEEEEVTEATDAAPPTTTETIEAEETTTTTTAVEETTTKPTEEQENVNGTGVVPASVSPGRLNLPFKEVNESGNDESATVASTAAAETTNAKKRELDPEDEQTLETTEENDERAGDQAKKMKLSESTEASTESKECESNNGHPIVNGNSAVEV